MQLTEQHIIDRKDPRFAVIDAAEAQSRAAKAAEDSANYLWYSVAVLAGSSVATLLVSIANLIVSIRH